MTATTYPNLTYLRQRAEPGDADAQRELGWKLCGWCGTPFKAVKRGDREKRFCSDRCRAGFHSAARQWVQMAIEDGRLTFDELRRGVSSPCTAKPARLTSRQVSHRRKPDKARHGAVHGETAPPIF